jgi:tetratricopeptide (TPR) repeat protein
MTQMRWSGFGILAGALLLLAGCRRAPEPDPTGPAITATTLGMVYLEEGRLPEAEAEFRKVIGLIPRASSGYGNLAQVFLRSGRYPEAEAEILKALERDSTRVEFHLLLARVYQRTDRAEEARQLLESRLGEGPGDPRVLYALATLARSADDSLLWLRRTVESGPANLAARLELAVLLAGHGEPDSALAQLEELQKQWPEPPREAETPFTEAVRLLRAGQADQAALPLDRFRRTVELTPAYQSARLAIAAVGGPVAGFPVLTFSPIIPMPGQERSVEDAVRFNEATAESGLPAAGDRGMPAALAAGDIDGDGSDDLLVGGRIYRNATGRFSEATAQPGFGSAGGVTVAAFADYDNDGHMDLFATGANGGLLFHGSGNGTFEDATAAAELGGETGVRAALFVDADHDGDLDLFLATAHGNRLYRNNLDGSFAEVAGQMGLAGGPASGATFADFDGDGLIDLLVSTDEEGATLFRNQGQQRFESVARRSGLPARGGTAAVGDYDNDGFLDLFVGGKDGADPVLYRNAGDGTFTADRRAGRVMGALRSIRDEVASFLDYDNDGRLDLVVAGTASGSSRTAFLFHGDGDGRFTDRSARLPGDLGPVQTLLVTDIDQDGDEDLVLALGNGAVRHLRNDGGNANPYVMVQLTALRTGSGKNNSFGLGARVELRAGDLYQARVVTSRLTHFGLGSHRTADALRIEWPNGVPQVLSPGVTGEVREAEVLKGSCAFAYAWDGSSFQLVTDVMWKSALGMPLGIMGSNTTYGPPGASTEYIRIPGTMLVPKDGRYVLQLTEELWETAYLDQVRLLVVDHPDSVDIFVNERFVPPGPTPLRLYQSVRPRPPVSAVDGEGNDLLPDLLARDDRYVSNLTPTRYQGITEPHDLILDLGNLAGMDSVFLFLNGWIYPSDASINVAVAQSGAIRVTAPSLEVLDAHGRWRTAIADLGFPAGKRKTVIANLTGLFPTPDHRVRIRTSMQIYWDQAFVAGSADASPVTLTTLDPVAADLHYRGFSRTFRKGGRYGPQWFDYADVSTDNPWRLITGRFTRFGDVLPLLREPDDMYLVMAPGDEATIHFDATAAPDLPPGWRRDFLLYSDGWIKDSDLNTATGTAVGPLPFHAMSRYPYGADESYPAGDVHRSYLRNYQTREIGRGSR